MSFWTWFLSESNFPETFGQHAGLLWVEHGDLYRQCGRNLLLQFPLHVQGGSPASASFSCFLQLLRSAAREKFIDGIIAHQCVSVRRLACAWRSRSASGMKQYASVITKKPLTRSVKRFDWFWNVLPYSNAWCHCLHCITHRLPGAVWRGGPGAGSQDDGLARVLQGISERHGD